MKKKHDYRCNSCMVFTCANKRELISHVRQEHPEDGWRSCWDAIGDLGDPFANHAMRTLQERTQANREALERAQAKAKEYDALVARYDALIRCLQIIKPAVDIAVEATWRK